MVQKKKKISQEQARLLRKKNLIEGRAPNFHLSASVHTEIGEKTKYIKNRGFDKGYYEKLILEFLRKFKKGTRKDINVLLMDKLPDVLTEKQKSSKITNLIYELSKKKRLIENQSKSTKFPVWVLKQE
jgi:ATP-dependent DNA helicase RecG